MTMKTTVTFLVVIFLVAAVQSAKDAKLHRIVRLYEFVNCRDVPQRTFRITSGKVHIPAKNVYAFSGEGVAEKATRKFESVVMNITKCADRSKVKCEHFQRIEWKSSVVVCPLLAAPRMPWSGVLNSYDPQIRCTNPKGHYVISNLSSNADELNKLQFALNDYYIARVEFFDQDMSPWMCFDSEFDFPRVRA